VGRTYVRAIPIESNGGVSGKLAPMLGALDRREASDDIARRRHPD
jgi:hypothetical protein